MAEKKSDWVVATDTVVAFPNGHRVYVVRGDTYPRTHPVVKVAGCFVSPDEWARMTGVRVEQATAAPGEVRNVETPKGKTAKS